MLIRIATTEGIPQYRRLQIWAKAQRLARKRGNGKVSPLDVGQAQDWVIERVMRRRNLEGNWPVLKKKTAR